MLPTAKREDGRKDFGDYKLAPIIETGSFLATRSFTATEICPR